MAEEFKPEVIKPPHPLRGKVKVGGPGAVDMAALERAEQVIASMGPSYLEWVREDLANIGAAFDALKAGRGDQAAALDRVFQISHDMKGQGGSFGYNLITTVGNGLCRLLERLGGKADAAAIDVIKLHIDTMKLVIAESLTGDGGPKGERLLKGLELVVGKVAAKK